MSKKASPTVIGLFTLIGILLAGGAAVLLGAGKYFQKSFPVLLYFDKSANGLQVGSDVRFGGVRIGSVESISVLIDPVENRKIIPVVVKLDEKDLRLISTAGEGSIDFSTRAGVEKAVGQGLRGGMKQQSLVTGQLYIEFDIVPDSEGFIYRTPTEPSYPVIPTTGTQIDELIAGVADGLKKFNALDLDGIMKELRDVLTAAKAQIGGLDIRQINDNIIALTEDIGVITSDDKLVRAVENLDAALAQIDGVATKANAGIGPLLEDLKGVIARTDAAVAKIVEATSGLSDLSSPRAPVMMRLQNVLSETERASRALKELSVDLKRDPNTLLRGRATPP
jgi:paraquat-inducible protein B